MNEASSAEQLSIQWAGSFTSFESRIGTNLDEKFIAINRVQYFDANQLSSGLKNLHARVVRFKLYLLLLKRMSLGKSGGN